MVSVYLFQIVCEPRGAATLMTSDRTSTGEADMQLDAPVSIIIKVIEMYMFLGCTFNKPTLECFHICTQHVQRERS